MTGNQAVANQKLDADQDLAAYVSDGIQCMTAFKEPITESAPHIYLSALPFSPLESKVWKQYHTQFPNTIVAQMGRAMHWPAMSFILDCHTRLLPPSHSRLTGSALSPAHTIRQFGSGMRRWRTRSEPIKGHTRRVTSVAFSPEGKRIVSGSWDQTIRVWKSETGELVSEPFQGHTGLVASVAFSLDGKRIVSARTIRQFGSGMRIRANSFPSRSSDTPTRSPPSLSRLTVTESSDSQTIRVWDEESELIPEPFKGHTNRVASIAFSPDGHHIVSGSDNQTVWVRAEEMDSWFRAVSMTTASHNHGVLRNASASGFSNESKWDGGWIVCSQSELLFWVPPLARNGCGGPELSLSQLTRC